MSSVQHISAADPPTPRWVYYSPITAVHIGLDCCYWRLLSLVNNVINAACIDAALIPHWHVANAVLGAAIGDACAISDTSDVSDTSGTGDTSAISSNIGLISDTSVIIDTSAIN